MIRFILGALALALATPVLAEAPSYNYATLSWQSADLDDDFFDVDGDGFGISGSFEIGQNWHVVGGYSSIGFDFGVDLNVLEVGAGWHNDISPNASFYANALWVNAEVEASGFGSADESGFGVDIGLRGNIGDRFELEAGLGYRDLGDGADGTSFGGAGWYKFNDQFAVGLGIEIDEDVNSYGIGGRFYF